MKIVKENGIYHFFNKVEIDTELEAKNYTLAWDAKNNPYIRDENAFELPKKLYDVDREFIDQVLTSAKVIPRNIGICLKGYKGQGGKLFY